MKDKSEGGEFAGGKGRKMSGLAFDHREKDKTTHKGNGLIQCEKEHLKKGKGNTRVDSSKGKHPERDHCAHTHRGLSFQKKFGLSACG